MRRQGPISCFVIIILILGGVTLSAQSLGFQGQSRYVTLMDRLEIKYGLDASGAIRYYSTKQIWQQLDTSFIADEGDRYEVNHFMNQYNFYESESSDEKSTIKRAYIDSTNTFYSIESEDLDYTKQNYVLKSRTPVLNYFYKQKHHFLSFDKEYIKVRANPIFDLRYGNAQDDGNIVFRNTRGAELTALIDKKIYIYTRILENQQRFNNYVDQTIPTEFNIPGNGFFKNYQSTVSDDLNGWDYLNTQAYIGLPISKHVGIEMGHGQHFIGNGVRSLLLSDFANNYFYLKLDTKVWKFHYQNIFAELAAFSSAYDSGDNLISKKYMANHFLTFDVTKNFQVGVFETVVFSRENQFELQYLNPVILYRTVEQSLGSPDNVLIGFNLRYNLFKRYQVYGQAIIDEFKRDEFGEGWWGNKFGFQGGLKYIDAFGIGGLLLRAEYNQVRPYTYAQSRPLANYPELTSSNYSHNLQPLAHPLGANFREFILGMNWRVNNKLNIEGLASLMQVGEETGEGSFGSDILLNTRNRIQEYNNEIGQGVGADIINIRGNISYEFRTNYMLDLNAVVRMKDSQDDARDLETFYLGAGVRANIGMQNFDF